MAEGKTDKRDVTLQVCCSKQSCWYYQTVGRQMLSFSPFVRAVRVCKRLSPQAVNAGCIVSSRAQALQDILALHTSTQLKKL